MSYKKYSSLILPFSAFLIFFLDKNATLFLNINQIGEFLPDVVWEMLTTFGNKPFALVVLFLVCWKKPDLLIATLIASVVAGVISSTLKPLFDLARPTDVLALSDYHLIGPKITGHSFPSGHTMSAFAIASSLVFFFKKQWITIGMLSFAGFVGLSRIMLGVHWPIDVLIGAMIGLACGYAGVQFMQIQWLQKSKLKLVLVTFLYFLLSIKLLWRGTGYDDVQGLVKIVAIAGAVFGLGLLYRQYQNYRSI